MFTILGATGKVGFGAASALRRAGAPVRAVVRDRARAGKLADLGCEIAVADLKDAASLARVCAGAAAVQVICPANPLAADVTMDMRRTIDSVAEALRTARPNLVLAISDYGAERSAGNGITVLFHEMEQRLLQIQRRLILLRSAEHMQNWAHLIGVSAQTGVLPGLRQPLSRPFATVSAFDVGAIAAELLLSAAEDAVLPRVVHAEGPRRYAMADIALAIGTLVGRAVTATTLPRAQWDEALRGAGFSASYAALIAELCDDLNAALLDAAPDRDDIRYGRTEMIDALRPLAGGDGAGRRDSRLRGNDDTAS